MTVIDISKDGSLSREEISQVALDELRAELADKLRHSSLELKGRLICVSHLTPHTAKPLKAYYDLSIDFLNGDLSHSEISLVVRKNDLSFHSRFDESYVHDCPFLERSISTHT